MGDTKKQERAAVAGQRSNVYGFLATVYRQEVTSDLLCRIRDPRFLGVLSGLGVELASDFFEGPEKALLEDLAVEYAALFLGPGEHISPHESVHCEGEGAQSGQLWGEATVAVKKFIESAGLSYESEYKGFPDHISVELEFMQQVTRREEQAWGKEDEKGALYCLKIQKKFIEEHLFRWIPLFCEKVIRVAELPFYREMAALTRSFIEFEKEEVNEYMVSAGNAKEIWE